MQSHTQNETDAVDRSGFQGENHFFYWKTSSSLWKERLSNPEEFKGDKVFVPINWAFHTETGDRFDFAGEKPETNLSRIEKICDELHKELVFLLPLGPAPYMVNGGVPSLIARSPAYRKEGVIQHLIDKEGQINRLYSAFDSRIYMAFAKFAHALGQYFTRSGVRSRLCSAEFGYFSYLQFSSLFNDHSQTFNEAFLRYLKSVHGEGWEEVYKEIQTNIDVQEFHYREFYLNIHALYSQCVEEALASNFEKHLSFHVLGDLKTFCMGLFPKQTLQGEIGQQLIECYRQNIYVTSSLVPERLKLKTNAEIFSDLYSADLYQKMFNENLAESDQLLSYHFLSFMSLFTDKRGARKLVELRKSGLLNYIEQELGACFRIYTPDEFSLDEDGNEYGMTFADHILFFSASCMNEKTFRKMLKAFMSGKKIVLDRSGIDTTLLKKLEVFLMENDLMVEKVHIYSDVHNINLGEGRITVVQSDKLSEIDASKQQSFWSKIFGTYDIHYLKVDVEQPLLSTWKTRAATPNELKFEEVRRLLVYNPTSYRKKVSMVLTKNFVLKRIVKENNTKIHHKDQNLNIEILPGGSFALDFGVFY
ncbi:MAG: hypothetical protein ACPGJV_09300 [Bacteriovoracaceae bacterium]